jgi:hypothetical protein
MDACCANFKTAGFSYCFLDILSNSCLFRVGQFGRDLPPGFRQILSDDFMVQRAQVDSEFFMIFILYSDWEDNSIQKQNFGLKYNSF